MIRRLCCSVVALCLSVAGAAAQSAAYAGRPLADVLRDLQRRGLNVVFSSELVKPNMRVTAEPRAAEPRKILDEVLAPHRLRVTRGSKGALLVVRAPRPPSEPPAAALRTGAIHGRVIDKRSGIALPGVSVTVQGSTAVTITDSDGAFQLDGVPAEPQPLFVSLVGYGLARPMVNVEPDQTTEITIALADGLGAYSEEVTVVGDRFRGGTPAAPSQQTLTNADLQDLRGVIADDPLRAVQALPGAATGDDFRSEFSVRGSDFRHIGLSFDGIPLGWFVHLTRGLQDTGSVSIVNGDVIEQATLVSGPYPQRTTGRTGAWLSFDLQDGSRTATQGHLSVSGTTSSISINGPLGARRRGSWLASVRQSYLQWILNKIDPSGGSAFGFTDGVAKFTYDVSPRQQLRFSVLGGRSKLGEKDTFPGPNAVGTAINRSAVATLAWQATWGRVLLSQSAAVMRGRFTNTGQFGQANGEGKDGASWYVAGVKADLGRGLLLNAGGTLEWSKASQTLRQFAFGSTPNSTVLTREDSLGESLRSSVAHGGITWTRADGAMVDGGVSVSSASVVDETPVSSWALASWPIARGLSVRAGVSTAAQFPDVFQVARYGGSAPMRPERAVSADVAVEQRLSPAVRWQITLFNRHERDVYRLDNSEARLVGNTIIGPSLTQLWRNALTGNSRGAELMIQRRAATGLSGWVSYSYGRARYTDEAQQESFWADFDQRHAFNTYGLFRFTPKTSVSGKIRLGSNFPLTGYFSHLGSTLLLGRERNTERLPAYSRLDLRLNHAFAYTRRRLTLFVEVLNVLGHANYGTTDGAIRSNGTLAGFTEKLMPFLPSIGFVFDF